MNKIFSALILFMILATVPSRGFAAKIGEDLLIIGKSGSSANKNLKLGSTATIRYDAGDSTLKFSNDGSTFAAFGSGGGSSASIGYNLLTSTENYGFEDGTTGWTASGGSFTIDSSTPLFGAKSAVFDASALNQTLSSTAKTVITGLKSQDCVAAISYKYAGTAGDYNLQVYDGTSVVAETALPQATTPAVGSVEFTCPSSGTLLVRLIAKVANPGAITFDGPAQEAGFVYLGSLIPLTAEPTQYFWMGYHANDCQWAIPGASFANPSIDASCTLTEVRNKNFGTVTSYNDGTPGNNYPGIVFTPPKIGEYYVCAGIQSQMGGSSTSSFELSDTSGGPVVIGYASTRGNASTFESKPDICGFYNVSSLSAVTLRVRLKGDTSNLIYGVNGAVVWTIKRVQ